MSNPGALARAARRVRRKPPSAPARHRTSTSPRRLPVCHMVHADRRCRGSSGNSDHYGRTRETTSPTRLPRPASYPLHPIRTTRLPRRRAETRSLQRTSHRLGGSPPRKCHTPSGGVGRARDVVVATRSKRHAHSLLDQSACDVWCRPRFLGGSFATHRCPPPGATRGTIDGPGRVSATGNGVDAWSVARDGP